MTRMPLKKIKGKYSNIILSCLPSSFSLKRSNNPEEIRTEIERNEGADPIKLT
jgi:hypothetical protein